MLFAVHIFFYGYLLFFYTFSSAMTNIDAFCFFGVNIFENFFSSNSVVPIDIIGIRTSRFCTVNERHAPREKRIVTIPAGYQVPGVYCLETSGVTAVSVVRGGNNFQYFRSAGFSFRSDIRCSSLPVPAAPFRVRSTV